MLDFFNSRSQCPPVNNEGHMMKPERNQPKLDLYTNLDHVRHWSIVVVVKRLSVFLMKI